MVRGDIQNGRYLGMEFICGLQLETADFRHSDTVFLGFVSLQGIGNPDVSYYEGSILSDRILHNFTH